MDLKKQNFIINRLIRVDPNRCKIWVGKSKLNVEPRLMRLLIFLCEHNGKECLRSVLVEQIWGNKWIGEEGLTKAISELRKILGDSNIIRTIPKRGYSLDGEITPERRRLFIVQSKFSGIALPISVMVLILVVGMFSSVEFVPSLPQGSNTLQYLYMTDQNGLHLSPAISSDGELVAHVERRENDKRFSILVKSTQSGEVVFEIKSESRDYDCPAFSPNGESIAFISNENGSSFLCTAHIGTGNVTYIHQLNSKSSAEVDWSPLGNLLVFNDLDSNSGVSNLFAYDLDEQRVTQMTNNDLDETSPVISSDGLQVALIQKETRGTLTKIAVLNLSKNSLNVVSEIQNGVVDLDWTDDDQGLVFTSNTGYESLVYKLTLSTGLITQVTNQSFYQLATNQNQLLTSKYESDNNIWIKELTSIENQARPILNSSRQEVDGVISPDQSKIAFVTDISGSFQIWEYDLETEKRRQLTEIENANRFDQISWSPAGEDLLVGYQSDLGTRIIRVSLVQKNVSILIEDGFVNQFPQYHKSGSGFSFISDRSGKAELWFYDLSKRAVKKVSNVAGEIAFARLNFSSDSIYFVEVGSDGLWKAGIAGGPSAKVLCLDGAWDYSNWELFRDGIYFIDRTVPNYQIVKYHSFADDSERAVFRLPSDNKSYNTKFSISNDESKMAYNQIDHFESDIVFLRINSGKQDLLKAQVH